MRQTHVAGEKLFVDFAGDTVPVFDAADRGDAAAHIFVAVLGASNYTYAEARWSEGLADWIGAHVDTLDILGGVPKLIVCDNLKAGVTAACRYEPGINRTYQEMAGPLRHRDPAGAVRVSRATRPRSRWRADRRAVRPGAAAQPAVLLAGRTQCRRSARLLADLNARLMRKLGVQPRRVVRGDRPAGARCRCRSAPYQYAEWKKCRVAPDYHVEIARPLLLRAARASSAR